MVSTFSPNIQLEEPARGDQVGVWDTPVNNNMNIIDLVTGGTVTIPLAASGVVLSAAQFQAKTLVFSSTLLASVDITFPTSFTKSYEILHSCTGSSAFTITLRTTVAGSQVVCAVPGMIVEIANIGGNMLYRNLIGPVGTYWDYAGTATPNWVGGCSIPPLLPCNGGSFSSGIYPVLTIILGGTTMPDSRGRTRAAIDGGTARLSSAVAGFNPDTVGAGGGSQNLASHNHNIFITDPGHVHSGSFAAGGGLNNNAGGGGGAFGAFSIFSSVGSATTGVTATSSAAGTGTAANVQPTYIGGVTLIRAG